MTEMLLFLAAPFTLTVLLVGIHAYLGLHVLRRDVIFVDISLSQVAALGGALSLFYTSNEESALSIGFALGLCLLASFALALFRKFERRISQEAIIGITYALASGALILVLDHLPHGGEHLKEALVGNILFVTWGQVLQTAAIYFVIGLLHVVFRRQFWANSSGDNKSFFWDFLFYFLFGIVITFSTHHAGVLVVFSILVVPAALACRFFDSTARRLAFAWGFGLAASAVAFLLSVHYDWPAGAAIVSTLTAGFFAILISRLAYETLCDSSGPSAP
jgi:zinc/manganese transport system permease protein